MDNRNRQQIAAEINRIENAPEAEANAAAPAAPVVPVDDLGYQIMSEEAFGALLLAPADLVVTKVETLSFNGCRLEIFNERYLSRPSRNLLTMMTGGELAEYDVLNPATEAPLRIPAMYNDLVLIAKSTVIRQNDKHVLLKGMKDNFTAALGLFTLYPQFGPIYEKYLRQPDEGTTTMAPGEAFTATFEERDGKTTRSDVRASVYLFLLLMTKTFPADQADAVSGYIEKRLKAARSFLNSSSARFLLTNDFIKNASTYWAEYPKIRRYVFELIVTLKDVPEFEAALVLLSKSSMVTINCMVTFIACDFTTRAHMFPEVWEEVVEFNQKLKALQDRFGSRWPFLRVLEPKNSDLATSKFPNLSKAAVLYYKTFIDNSAIFARVKVPNHETVATLAQAATEEVDPSFLVEEEEGAGLAGITEDQKRVARSFKFDLAKWLNPKTHRVVARQGNVRGNNNQQDAPRGRFRNAQD